MMEIKEDGAEIENLKPSDAPSGVKVSAKDVHFTNCVFENTVPGTAPLVIGGEGAVFEDCVIRGESCAVLLLKDAGTIEEDPEKEENAPVFERCLILGKRGVVQGCGSARFFSCTLESRGDGPVFIKRTLPGAALLFVNCRFTVFCGALGEFSAAGKRIAGEGGEEKEEREKDESKEKEESKGTFLEIEGQDHWMQPKVFLDNCCIVPPRKVLGDGAGQKASDGKQGDAKEEFIHLKNCYGPGIAEGPEKCQ